MAWLGDHALNVEVVDAILRLVPCVQCSSSDSVVNIGWQNAIVVNVIVVVCLVKRQQKWCVGYPILSRIHQMAYSKKSMGLIEQSSPHSPIQ